VWIEDLVFEESVNMSGDEESKPSVNPGRLDRLHPLRLYTMSARP
jgi:hypothetical protein